MSGCAADTSTAIQRRENRDRAISSPRWLPCRRSLLQTPLAFSMGGPGCSAGHSAAGYLRGSRSDAWQNLWLLLIIAIKKARRATELVSCELSHSRNRRRVQFTAAELQDKAGPVREYRDECDGSSVPVLRGGRRVQADGTRFGRAFRLSPMRSFGDPNGQELRVCLPEVLRAADHRCSSVRVEPTGHVPQLGPKK